MIFDSLEELRTFSLVVDLGSLSAVARRLQVTTNAVSRRIQRLEKQVGARLLNRTTRHLSVTDEGRLLYVRCERVLRELSEAETELTASRGQLSGTVRLAISAGGVEFNLLNRLRELLEVHPSLSVLLSVTRGPIDPVSSGMDIAVVVGEPLPPSVVARRLGTVAWKLAATPDYLVRHGRPRTPRDLIKHRCLRLLSDRPQLEWRLIDGRGREVVVGVGGTFECDDSRALGDATYAGLGIGVRPDDELTRAIEDGRLEAVLPGYRFGAFPLFAILPPGRLRVPRVAAVLNLLKRAWPDQRG